MPNLYHKLITSNMNTSNDKKMSTISKAPLVNLEISSEEGYINSGGHGNNMNRTFQEI